MEELWLTRGRADHDSELYCSHYHAVTVKCSAE